MKKECDINPSTGRLQESFMYIDLGSVVKGRLNNPRKIDKTDAPSRAQRILSENDIIFQCVRPYQMNNYIFKGFNDKSQWVASTGYAQLRTANNNPEYIYFLLNSPQFNKKVILECTGSNYPAINSEDLSKIPFYKSSSTIEQEKIAHILLLLDQRITTQNKIIEDLKKLKSAIVENEFLRIEGKEPLGNYVKLQGGYAFKSAEFKAEGMPLIRISNLSQDSNRVDMRDCVFYKEGNYSNYIISKGMLLIAMSGATTGKTAIYTEEKSAYLNQRVGCFRSSKIYYPYLYVVVESSMFKNQLNTKLIAGAQPNISSADIESIIVPIPTYSIQNHIAKEAVSLDKKILIEFQLLCLYTQEKRYLLQQMFI